MPAALEWSAYTDPSLQALEREGIFVRAWQYVGHLAELGEGAGYVARRVGDIPVVVTRDRTGLLRAFLNVCRHRGSVLAAGAAARETLQCPYHARTYGLDGALRSAPRSDREAGFDGEGISLRPASVGACGPFLFVNPDPEAARSQFHFLWPNTMINIFPGRTNFSIGPVLPAGPERTERFLDYFFGSEAEEGWIQELLEVDGQVGAEDKVLVENVQRGVTTGLIERGRLLPESERLIVDFQQRIRSALS